MGTQGTELHVNEREVRRRRLQGEVEERKDGAKCLGISMARSDVESQGKHWASAPARLSGLWHNVHKIALPLRTSSESRLSGWGETDGVPSVMGSSSY